MKKRFAYSLMVVLAMPGCIIGGNGSATPTVDAAPDAGRTCEPPVQNVGDGHHFPGENCLGCHDDNLSDGAPAFTLGGTLYNGPSGVKPTPNATIIVVDAANRKYFLPTQQNGNFYSSAAMVFPVTVSASQCPKTKPMVALSVGNCNSGSCHGAGSPTGRVYLQGQ
jgi:hypothetical protein